MLERQRIILYVSSMSMKWTKKGACTSFDFELEADLEAAILAVQSDLFGKDRIYLDIKKKIGEKGGQRNIPDGYLIHLSAPRPKLYTVENELWKHEPLRHIAVQILQFSLSFESSPRRVKKILMDALQQRAGAMQQGAARHNLRNLDHLVEVQVVENDFAALVIIDYLDEELKLVLEKKFQFTVEVLELARYQIGQGEPAYFFEPFLADLTSAVGPTETLDISTIDTVVVPGDTDGVQDCFLGEDRWYQIRLRRSMHPQINYIAAYQTAPVSAITHIAPVQSIEPWKETGKLVVNFSAPARPIGPIPLVKGGRVNAPRDIRYAIRQRLDAAQTLDDLW